MDLSRKQGYGIKWMIGVVDMIVVNVVFYIVYHSLDLFFTSAFDGALRIAILLLNVSYFFALYMVPLRVHHSVVFIDKVVQRAMLLVSTLMFFFSTSLLFMNIGDRLGTFLITFYIVLLLIFTLWRMFLRLTLKWYRRKGYYFKRVIIVGAGKNGMELYRVMKNEQAYGFNVLDFFDDNIALKRSLPNYLGMTHQVEDFVLANQIDEIYCTLPGTRDEQMLRLMNFSEKNMIRFYIVPEFFRKVKKSLVMQTLESVPLLTIRREPLQSAYNRSMKRVFDIIFSSLVLLLIFFWFYVIIGFLIKITSKGPIFFKQKRTGLYGREFNCYKFRTMRLNKDADILQACKRDPRITKIGEFLRHTSLDEIPQFINVFKGEMSVVGPRPHMLRHTEQYSHLIDKYMIRHLVKPGLTGWAQVTGYRGETRSLEQMEGRVKRDVWYIENWSFMLDLKIIIVTVFNMFKGDKVAF